MPMNIGYIYSITPINGDDDNDIYYGSTTNISKRWYMHKTILNDCNSKLLFSKYGIDNCQINVIEEYKYNDKSELLYRERYYIENNNCLNKFKPITTDIEKREYKKTYENEHKTEKAVYNKQYRETNKDEIKEKHKEYYDENKELIAEKYKKYYDENKEEILKKSKEWKDNNKEHTAEQFKKWVEEHKEERAIYKKEWAQQNKDKLNVQIECELCKKMVAKKSIRRHQQTKNCKNNIK
jgi:hypothetical protein